MSKLHKLMQVNKSCSKPGSLNKSLYFSRVEHHAVAVVPKAQQEKLVSMRE